MGRLLLPHSAQNYVKWTVMACGLLLEMNLCRIWSASMPNKTHCCGANKCLLAFTISQRFRIYKFLSHFDAQRAHTHTNWCPVRLQYFMEYTNREMGSTWPYGCGMPCTRITYSSGYLMAAKIENANKYVNESINIAIKVTNQIFVWIKYWRNLRHKFRGQFFSFFFYSAHIGHGKVYRLRD